MAYIMKAMGVDGYEDLSDGDGEAKDDAEDEQELDANPNIKNATISKSNNTDNGCFTHSHLARCIPGLTVRTPILSAASGKILTSSNRLGNDYVCSTRFNCNSRAQQFHRFALTGP